MWDNAFVYCKDFTYIGLIKHLLDSGQTGNTSWATRLRGFWEDERQRCNGKPDTEEKRLECLTEKRYQATWLNIDKNYGLFKL